jgi:enoyl-CoA hydratase
MPTWTLERHGALAVLVFSRPPSNLVDFASIIELGDHLEALAAESDKTTVVLLTSSVDDVFMDHAELSDLARAGAGRVAPRESDAWPRALRLLEEIPQPTIAAIDGLASGGGNEVALCCTLRVGSERARLQQPEVTVGLIPGGGGSVRLPRLVGTGVAAEALLTGRIYNASEALQTGWINALLPVAGFRDEARRWASTIAAHSANALAAAKKSIVAGSRAGFADAVSLEHELFTELAAMGVESP